MKSKRIWIPVVAAITLCTMSMIAGADRVSTHQALGQTTANHDRAHVQAILDRNDAREKLQTMGIEIDVVKERLARLTDSEVH